MTQVPATPKLRRFLLRQATGGLGAEWALRRIRLTASERAAIRLRRLGRLPKPPKNPPFTFLIPLVGPKDVTDWDGVTQRLARTVESLKRQDYTNWTAYICCQERPSIPWSARVRYLPFREEVDGNDKWAKLRRLTQALLEQRDDAPDGYAMSFDADDLLADGQLSLMAKQRKRGGYLVTRGYVADIGAGRVALAEPQSLGNPGQKAFWKLCGSCTAFRYDLKNGPEQEIDFLAQTLSHEHRMFPYLADLSGRPLTPLEDPAVMYLLNHGDNFGARRGRTSFKSRFAQRFEVRDEEQLAEIRARFPAF
ncbi:hypothetical protein AADZ90_019105 [Aestuariibius sp. 2305UL40-4]|uniref:hypothetical protein n=1 Tax=Aestuariibius violaceus TaxID=3234132 RepID=UPI00345E79F9